MRFPLGEMTVGDILDRGIKLLLARLPLFYIINLFVLSPVIALQVVVPFIDQPEVVIGKNAFDPTIFLVGAGVGLAVFLLAVILAPIGSAAILRVIMQTYVGKPTSLGDAFSFALSRFFSLILANILVGLIVGIGTLLCCVPGIFFWVAYAFVAQVVVLEKRGPGEALPRSWALTQGYRWRVFGVLVLVFIVVGMAQGMVSAGLQQVLPAQDIVQGDDEIRIVRHPENQAIDAVITQLVSILFTSYMAVCTTLLYLDLRIRKEGFDLELAAQLGEEVRGPRRRNDDYDDEDYDDDRPRRRQRDDDEYDDRPRRRRDEPDEDPEEGLDRERPLR